MTPQKSTLMGFASGGSSVASLCHLDKRGRMHLRKERVQCWGLVGIVRVLEPAINLWFPNPITRRCWINSQRSDSTEKSRERETNVNTFDNTSMALHTVQFRSVKTSVG